MNHSYNQLRTFVISCNDRVNPTSDSTIVNSDKWVLVREFSARNVGPKLYTREKALQIIQINRNNTNNIEKMINKTTDILISIILRKFLKNKQKIS